ncbi:MAG TPA: GyrI-like domain-containing protein [Anaerolineae bacterium]|jgi:AraC family transcriptional regulator|nr:GyrI-like domain-containing protein [Anaerolineae bacterium]
MNPRIVSKRAFTVAGLKYQGKNENNEIPALWQALGPRMGEFRSVVDQEAAYGVIDLPDQESDAIDYMAGVAVGEEAPVPQGMTFVRIPEQTYAVFRTTLPTLMDTFHRAYDEWLPASGYKRAPGPEFERYGETFDPENPESEMEIWIPIEPA